MVTLVAFDPNIRTQPHYFPFITATRMGLAKANDIPNSDLHDHRISPTASVGVPG